MSASILLEEIAGNCLESRRRVARLPAPSHRTAAGRNARVSESLFRSRPLIWSDKLKGYRRGAAFGGGCDGRLAQVNQATSMAIHSEC